MKKNIWITLLCVVVVIAIVGTVGFVVWKANTDPAKKDNEAPSDSNDSSVSPEDEDPTQYSGTFKIGIVQNGVGDASKDCYDGFIYELDDRNLMGNIEIEYVVEENEDQCRSKIKSLVDNGCDLLYTIGRFSSEAAAEITKDVPIVFGAVTNPEKVGLVESNKKPGGNVTGVSSYTPCFEQIDLISLLMPNAKKVAVMYSGTDENAVSQGIAASQWAERSGLSCTEYMVEDKSALKTVLGKVKSAKSDVIYIPVDKLLSKNMDQIIKFSKENKIPVFCGDEITLSQGGFATSEINYKSIGQKAAGMAVSILFEKKDVATFPVMYKHDCTNLVNKEMRDALGIEIPATALGEVELWEAPPEMSATTAPTTAEKKAPAATKAAQ